ncbi:MAG: flagellar hook-associated protein FlgK [Pseudomonadota bacterium]|nr:flagellar hook-associated protein FlgK [Pseudomonadota bacterium]
MSLGTALSTALSGLNVAGRASGVVSDNIANVMTPGYARRSLELSTRGDIAPGVRVVGTTRHVDPALLAGRRSADASLGNASVLAGYYSRLTNAIGTDTAGDSIAGRLAQFENSLISAASRPDSDVRLRTVVQEANALANQINAASDSIQDMRAEADAKIAASVKTMNTALSDIQTLNGRIVNAGSAGSGAEALMDQRQNLIDQINEIIPVRVVERERGQVALYTDGGVILLDGPAAKIDFTQTHTITPDMTLQSGALSEIVINGRVIQTGPGFKGIAGGTLAANFQIRDDLAVAAQVELDAQARDLVERFEDPAVDPTLLAGDPGLFTDNNAVFVVADEVGLAGRLKVNQLVDPAQGGEAWRIRDGLGAAVPGNEGDATLIQALNSALTSKRVPATGSFGSGALAASDIAATVISQVAQGSYRAERDLGFSSASQAELKKLELENGVDTDAELANLIIIEQAYAANARMIQVIDEMMESLLRI